MSGSLCFADFSQNKNYQRFRAFHLNYVCEFLYKTEKKCKKISGLSKMLDKYPLLYYTYKMHHSRGIDSFSLLPLMLKT